MRNTLSLFLAFAAGAFGLQAQTATGYEVKVSIKNSNDSACYMTKYTWEKPYIVDTAKVDKAGNMVFKGKKPLEKGIYSIYSPKKGVLYFDFIVNESQKLAFATDTLDFYRRMKITGPKENQDFLDFVLFMGSKNQERSTYEKEVKAKKTADSTKLLVAKNTELFNEIKKYQTDYLAKNPNNYLATLIRMQTEPEVPALPANLKTSADSSIWRYNYYKNHYWDGVPLDDIGTVNTNKLFSEKFKRYYEKVLVQNPDSLMKACDWLIESTKGNKEMFKWVTFNLTYMSETSKIMGMDAVFVHLINKYYRTGKAFWLDEKTLEKMLKRADVLEPLLIGHIAPDINMIDTGGIKIIHKLGMDTANSSQTLTKLYYDNLPTLQKLFVPLSKVKADYTVLLFWDVDCGHCKKEVPVILETYHKLKKEGVNIEVFAVYTQHEYDKWKKYIIENKLDWMNVADGVHLNNLKDKFDIFSTPVIYMLDKNKVIKAKRIGAEQIEDVIKIMQREAKEKEKK